MYLFTSTATLKGIYYILFYKRYPHATAVSDYPHEKETKERAVFTSPLEGFTPHPGVLF